MSSLAVHWSPALNSAIEKAIAYATRKHKVYAVDLFGPNRKTETHAAARGDVFLWLRGHVFETTKHTRRDIFFDEKPIEAMLGCRPISYPRLARLFAMDHTGVMLAVRRAKKRLIRDESEKQTADALA